MFERWKYATPNFSMRMSNLAAALLRPQLGLLAQRGKDWNHIYAMLEARLREAPGVSVPERHPKEEFVASSIQFTLSLEPDRMQRFLQECDLRGLYVKWFGGQEPKAFTSNYAHWHYITEKPVLPRSMAIMRQLLDLRTPLSLTEPDCELIGRIVVAAATIAAAAS